MTNRSRLLRLLFPGGRRGLGLTAALLVLVGSALYVPAALAFPYRAQFGDTTVYSVDPILPAMADRIARADRLLAASPIDARCKRTLALTGGGWRWRVMAFGQIDAIALRRPLSDVLIFNRTDIAADRVWNGAPIGAVRTLSGTIAHESVHVLTARRLGEVRMAVLPAWKREGYADHVAQETSIGADDEMRIRAADPNARVLAYYEARRRVAAVLARNGGSVDRLFAEK